MKENILTVESIEQQLIDIMNESEFFSLRIDKKAITPGTSIIRELSLDSIQLLEYLVAIEDKLKFNLDYQDLTFEVFETFHSLACYFYNKFPCAQTNHQI